MPISSDSYTVLESRLMLKHPRARIIIDTLEHEGQRFEQFYVESPVNGVAIVALTPEGQVLLTRHYRHAIRQVIYDLPAGHLTPAEDPLDGAKRELEEETGFRAGRIEPLGAYSLLPGMFKATIYLFFATDLVATQQRLDPGEELEVVALPFAEALAMVLRGECPDGSLQLGLLLAAQKGLFPSEG